MAEGVKIYFDTLIHQVDIEWGRKTTRRDPHGVKWIVHDPVAEVRTGGVKRGCEEEVWRGGVWSRERRGVGAQLEPLARLEAEQPQPARAEVLVEALHLMVTIE